MSERDDAGPGRAGAGTGRGGLRERKKAMARAAIEEAAFRLFLERGYEETTVGQIADAAVVSERTFFRYYGSKEDVLFSGIRAEVGAVEGALAMRPEGEPVRESFRRALEVMAAGYEERRGRLLALGRLLTETPSLRPRYLGMLADLEGVFLAFARARVEGGPNDRGARLLAAAAASAFRVAGEMWLEGGGVEDLPSLAVGNLEVLTSALHDS